MFSPKKEMSTDGILMPPHTPSYFISLIAISKTAALWSFTQTFDKKWERYWIEVKKLSMFQKPAMLR